MKNINITKTVGRNIRLLRKNAGLTTRMLATHLKVSQQQLSRYERGNNKIDINFIYKIHQFFDINVESLFCDTSPRNSKIIKDYAFTSDFGALYG